MWLKSRRSLQYRNIATTENLQTDSGHICRSHDECVSLPPRVSSLFVWPNTWDIILLLPCSRTQLKSPLTLDRVPLSLSGSTFQPLRSDFTLKVFHVLNVDDMNLRLRRRLLNIYGPFSAFPKRNVWDRVCKMRQCEGNCKTIYYQTLQCSDWHLILPVCAHCWPLTFAEVCTNWRIIGGSLRSP